MRATLSYPSKYPGKLRSIPCDRIEDELFQVYFDLGNLSRMSIYISGKEVKEVEHTTAYGWTHRLRIQGKGKIPPLVEILSVTKEEGEEK